MSEQLVHHLLVSSIIFAVGIAANSPFLDNCPDGCECPATVLRCENQDWHREKVTKLDNLRYRTDVRDPSSLQTVIIKGNSIGDLAGYPLFNEDVGHNVNELDLTDNQIESLDTITLTWLHRVQKLNLSNNHIENFGTHGNRYILGKLELLEELYMNSAFADDVDPILLADILRLLFSKENGQFAQLSHITLENNGIRTLHPETFCSLSSVKELSLKGNQLTTFRIDKNCQPGPVMLDLSDNLIQNIPASDVQRWRDSFTHISHMDFSGNKYNCDCHLEAFIEYLRAFPEYVQNAENTLCATATPSSFIGMSLLDVDPLLLQCPGDVAEGSSFFFILFIMAIAGCIIYFAYTRREWLRRRMTGRSAVGSPAGEYGVINGYRKLIGDDQNVPPEFV